MTIKPDILHSLDRCTRRSVLKNLCTVSVGAAAMGVSACARKLPPNLDHGYKNFCVEEPEITEPGKLIGLDGIARCGWMRKPLLDLNLEDARFYSMTYFQCYRLKFWDMYYIITPKHYIQFLVARIGYGAFCDAGIYDRETKQWKTGNHIRSPLPAFPMMRNSNEGITEFKSDKAIMRFEVEGEWKNIDVDFPSFAGVGLDAKIKLHHPAESDSICGVHLSDSKRVHYGEKITSMAAQGVWRLGKEEFALDPENCFGLLDFGRGYYPQKLFWYWATASGRAADGAVVGWNLGHGNDRKETLENALFYNGKIHKIGSVNVELDFDDFYRPWRVWSGDDRVHLTITPQNVRFNRFDLGLLYTIGRTALGLFNGYMVLDSGKKVGVENLFGLFEVVDQRW